MKKYLRNSQMWWIVVDLLAVATAYYLAILTRQSWVGQRLVEFGADLLAGGTPVGAGGIAKVYVARAPRILGILAPLLVVLYGLNGLYHPQRRLWPRPMLWNLLRANLLLFLLVMAALYFRRNLWHPRSFFVLFFVLNVWVARSYRYVADALLAWLRLRFDVGFWRVLLVGQGTEADRIGRHLFHNPQLGLRLVAHMRQSLVGDGSVDDGTLFEMADRECIDLLIVADAGISVDRIMSLLQRTGDRNMGLKVMTHALSVLQTHAGIQTDFVHGIPLVHFDPPSLNRKSGLPRRVLSWTLALGALIAVSPVLLLTAIAIKLEDDGPIFFIQERIGVNQQPFRMFKFRTMHVDAEARQAEFEKMNESGAGLFKIRRDQRITRVGAFLRKFSIDELPQLVNVIKGDMRLVGPRPLPHRDFERYYANWHYSRHAGMPGLTCLWQISGRSEIGFENMCVLDIFYLRNQHWAMDLKIVLDTVWVVLFGHGAY